MKEREVSNATEACKKKKYFSHTYSKIPSVVNATGIGLHTGQKLHLDPNVLLIKWESNNSLIWKKTIGGEDMKEREADNTTRACELKEEVSYPSSNTNSFNLDGAVLSDFLDVDPADVINQWLDSNSHFLSDVKDDTSDASLLAKTDVTTKAMVVRNSNLQLVIWRDSPFSPKNLCTSNLSMIEKKKPSNLFQLFSILSSYSYATELKFEETTTPFFQNKEHDFQELFKCMTLLNCYLFNEYAFKKWKKENEEEIEIPLEKTCK